MGQCPICKKKYSRDVEYCPRCQVGIIPSLNETVSEKKNTFVEVYRTEDVHLFFPLAYHGIKVMVYEEDIIEAKEILSLFFKEK